MTYEERIAVEQERDRLRRQREDERRNGVAETRANDSRIVGNNNAMHGMAGRKWLGGESGAVSDGSAMHGMAGRKWLGGGGQQTQEPGSRISVFASDGQGRISRSGADGVVRDYDAWGNALNAQRNAQIYGAQKASYDEMAQVMDTTRRENAKKQLALANDVASAMAFANGGVIPEELRNLINRRHGFDGRTTGILHSSGFTLGGNFDLIIGNGVDQNGNVVTSRQSFDPMSQYMMMGTNRAAFDDDDRANMRNRLMKLYGYSEKELAKIDRAFQQIALTDSRGTGGTGGAMSFDHRKELEQMKIDAQKEREKERNDLKKKEIRNRQRARLDKAKADALKDYLSQHSPGEYLEAAKAAGGTQDEITSRSKALLQAAAKKYVDEMFAKQESEFAEDWNGVDGKPNDANPQGGGQGASSVVDNKGDDNAPSKEYPGYSNGRARRALAAGWKWNGKTFERP